MSTIYVDNLQPNLGSQVEIPNLKPSFGIVQFKQLYNSDTVVAFNSQGGTQLGTRDFYYPVSARIGGSFTKIYDASTSYIITGGHYYIYASTNLHDFWMWISGDEDNGIHLGDDPYALSGEDGPSPRRQSKVTTQTVFTNLGIGTHTLYACAGTGDTRTHTGELNRNVSQTVGDMSDQTTRSALWIMEVMI